MYTTRLYGPPNFFRMFLFEDTTRNFQMLPCEMYRYNYINSTFLKRAFNHKNLVYYELTPDSVVEFDAIYMKPEQHVSASQIACAVLIIKKAMSTDYVVRVLVNMFKRFDKFNALLLHKAMTLRVENNVTLNTNKAINIKGFEANVSLQRGLL